MKNLQSDIMEISSLANINYKTTKRKTKNTKSFAMRNPSNVFTFTTLRIR